MTTPSGPPPLTLTGDDATDEALAELRSTTAGLHEASEQVVGLSARRRQLVLTLRARGVPFRQIAAAAASTEQTIFKVHREARAEQAAAQAAEQQEAAS